MEGGIPGSYQRLLLTLFSEVTPGNAQKAICSARGGTGVSNMILNPALALCALSKLFCAKQNIVGATKYEYYLNDPAYELKLVLTIMNDKLYTSNVSF